MERGCGGAPVHRVGATAVRPMIRIAISQQAFDAIVETMQLGSVGVENATDEQGRRLIWLAPEVVARLRALRGPGESFSDVILRVAASESATARTI